MGIRINRGFFAIGFAAVFLVGCASDKSDMEMDDGPGEMPVTTEMMDEKEPMAEPVAAKPKVPEVQNNMLWVPDTNGLMELSGVFYFDFDQAIVKRAGHMELNKHANALAGDRSIRLRLEGHADERGTREYNLALGERRANAVRAYLVAQGASRTQIEVISYGEEKPAAEGRSERAQAMNRRVAFSYR